MKNFFTIDLAPSLCTYTAPHIHPKIYNYLIITRKLPHLTKKYAQKCKIHLDNCCLVAYDMPT